MHDPTDLVVRLLFNVLAMVAELESDLIRLRTREGMKVAEAKGRLRGKQPKLSPTRKRSGHRGSLSRSADNRNRAVEPPRPPVALGLHRSRGSQRGPGTWAPSVGALAVQIRRGRTGQRS